MSTISTGNTKLGDSSEVNCGSETTRAGTQSSAWSRFGKIGALGGLIGLAGIGYSSSYDEHTGIHSLATFLLPEADSVDYSEPEKNPERVDLGMIEGEHVSSSDDLRFAVVKPGEVKRLTLGPWNTATDKDLYPLIDFNKLTHFSVNGGDNLSGAFLDYLRGIPLTGLSLEGLKNFNGENLKHLRYSGTLEQLVIVGSPLKSEQLNYFDELPALRSLAFENTGLTVKEIGDVVSRLFDKGAIPSLKDVVVRGVEGVTPDDITSARSWVEKVGSGASFTIQFRDGRFQELLSGGMTRE